MSYNVHYCHGNVGLKDTLESLSDQPDSVIVAVCPNGRHEDGSQGFAVVTHTIDYEITGE